MLEGLHIFAVEDETLVLMALEDMLAELGCEVAGSEASLDAAVAAIRGAPRIDAAVVDIELGGAQCWPVADVLFERQIPLVFSTGHGANAAVPTRFASAPILDKPYDTMSLADALKAALSQARKA